MRLLALAFAFGFVGMTAAVAQMTDGCPAAGQAPITMISQRGMVVGSVPRTPVHIPYSLVRTMTQVQTLSNGVQITTRSELREWHDAEGRTRTEIRAERNGEMQLQNIFINDPVLRQNITLYSKAQVAQVSRYPDPTLAANQQRPVDKAFQEAMKAEYQPQRTSHSESKNETLGTSVILGECAQGNRWTQVIPTGEMGNDGEIRMVSENWFSPRLGIQMRSITDDPRTGHVVNEVTELHVEAPDLSAFQAPPEYQVFDLTREPTKP